MAHEYIYSAGKISENLLLSLKNEEIIAHPTDTIYGFAGLANSKKVFAQLSQIKGRDASKYFSVMFKNSEQIKFYLQNISKQAEILIENFLPGTLTLILPINNKIKLQPFAKNSSIAVRIPNTIFCLNLLTELDQPLFTTSVNKSGEAPLNDSTHINHQFGDQITYLVKTNDVFSNIPSTIIDCTKNEISVVREGQILAADIFRVLK
jgi:L-threonylcarbamoyladenylate synthase